VNKGKPSPARRQAERMAKHIRTCEKCRDPEAPYDDGTDLGFSPLRNFLGSHLKQAEQRAARRSRRKAKP